MTSAILFCSKDVLETLWSDQSNDLTLGLINCLRRVDKRNEKIINYLLDALLRLLTLIEL